MCLWHSKGVTMCGIMAYSGHRPAIPLVVEGLKRLEYRGYDSAGVAFAQGDQLQVIKAEGKLAVLEEKLSRAVNYLATAAIGHTRWATHGVPAERNAHPQVSNDGSLAVVHNGIIENYQSLRENLIAQGYVFHSETDTEVIANLIAEERKHCPTLCAAFASAVNKAHGAYALVLLSKDEPHTIYAARLSAPLIVGVGVGECFIASDVPAFLTHTRQVIFLNDHELVRIHDQDWEVLNLSTLEPIQKTPQTITWDMQAAQKDGHKHFMLKEILEQPRVLTDAMAGRLHDGTVLLPELDRLFSKSPLPSRIRIVACGTSLHAGLWGSALLEQWGDLSVTVEIASEFRYRNPRLEPNELVLVISQSGETADTMGALRLAKQKGCTVLGVCNAVGSSITREADAVLYTQAGPEISVASTKALCSQMLVLTLMALYFAQRKASAIPADLIPALQALPALLQKSLPALQARARELAPEYASARSFFFLGRGQAYPLALEGALKLKELSYIHAEGYAAGEMKHGPIALIDPEFPTFALAFHDHLLPKVWSNIQEAQARHGRVIVLTNAPTPHVDPALTKVWNIPPTHQDLTAFLALPALQLFSYEMAEYLGKDVDQPRNLAKSVTVE